MLRLATATVIGVGRLSIKSDTPHQAMIKRRLRSYHCRGGGAIRSMTNNKNALEPCALSGYAVCSIVNVNGHYSRR